MGLSDGPVRQRLKGSNVQLRNLGRLIIDRRLAEDRPSLISEWDASDTLDAMSFIFTTERSYFENSWREDLNFKRSWCVDLNRNQDLPTITSCWSDNRVGLRQSDGRNERCCGYNANKKINNHVFKDMERGIVILFALLVVVSCQIDFNA